MKCNFCGETILDGYYSTNDSGVLCDECGDMYFDITHLEPESHSLSTLETQSHAFSHASSMFFQKDEKPRQRSTRRSRICGDQCDRSALLQLCRRLRSKFAFRPVYKDLSRRVGVMIGRLSSFLFSNLKGRDSA